MSWWARRFAPLPTLRAAQKKARLAIGALEVLEVELKLI
jgi:hypothetical protein